MSKIIVIMKYLAIAQNTDADLNITFTARTFPDAERMLKQRLKKGTMFQTIKLVELDTMTSKKYYFEKN